MVLDMFIVTPVAIAAKAFILPRLVYMLVRRDLNWAKWEVSRRLREDGLLQGYNDSIIDYSTSARHTMQSQKDGSRYSEGTENDTEALVSLRGSKALSLKQTVKLFSTDVVDILDASTTSQHKTRATLDDEDQLL